jgi:hypothetical protein
MTHSRGHAAPGIKQKAISVWLIPNKYVDCESERWQRKKNKKKQKKMYSLHSAVPIDLICTT